MMGYKDKTFCDYDKCKMFGICHRSLTDEVKLNADEWWATGGGKKGEAPIILFSERPACYTITRRDT